MVSPYIMITLLNDIMNTSSIWALHAHSNNSLKKIFIIAKSGSLSIFGQLFCCFLVFEKVKEPMIQDLYQFLTIRVGVRES